MRLPNLQYADKIRKLKQLKFMGLNHTEGAKDGDIWDMQNITSDHYPVLATREKRYLYRKLDAPGGIGCWDKLYWVDGTTFYYDGKARGNVTAGQKSFGALGAFIVILPDKCWYNILTEEFGSLESSWTGNALTFGNGKLYEEDADANMIQCEGVNWSDYFTVGDSVTISGCTQQEKNNQTIIIRDIDGDKLYFYEYSFTLTEDKEYQETGSLSIARTVPDLKFVFENENRLWGCTDTTIYSSKLGDIFNWNVYDGLDSDAYAVEPGSTGFHTGGISYRGYPVCFKEEHIYKVYGSVPSNFQVMGTATLGLAEGSGRSLAVAGETLFYLSRSGIMAYTGGIPQPVGLAFGTERFKNAVGGSDGLKYYVSMQDEAGAYWLYVYDTQRGLWHKEDRMRVTHFTYWDGNLYGLNESGEIWIFGNAQDQPEGSEMENNFPWYVEFADFDEGNPDKKGVGRLQIRMELDKGAQFEILIQYESNGIWNSVRRLEGEDPKRSYLMPVVPRRCDHYRIRLQGTGGCRIYSIAREYYPGSELRTYGRN